MRSALAGIALLALTACENAPRDDAPNPMLPTLAIASATPSDNAEIVSARQTIEFAGELTQGGWIRGQVPRGTDLVVLGDTELSVDPDGSFFAAFDRDASGSSTLRVTLKDGRVIDRPINVAPRAWNIEHVNVAKRSGGSSEAWWKKREPEWLAIKAAREKATGATGWQQDFIWPVKGRISGRFGSQRIFRGEPGSYHSGLDIAPGAGTPFVAPADGVVVLAADNFSLEGNLLIIDHGQGLNSAFLHASRLMVSEGDHVKQGQHIGDVGSSGRATGPHLHWSLKWHDARLDPLLFLDPDA
ncbi:M23 family metallopeptidase [Altererythrobacter sp.]|uniref:M23 family metallopeptidase n=1 Tax=Altererythrobacter sp. TaxID=1872480 RepID=UPI001B0A72BA|nr:M23 family metallopeptidase [Altererythrobacter sp.]MBO6609457.1 M23 family metallopeptidase [Altererythrobacter sp.]MBO6642324.1 M23 family metallopeptidase [Altererythrobacter sp.]MBO6709168.1 M23 family metallopeptidase [Altererythrobacter sp.]